MTNPDQGLGTEQSFFSHLIELRARLIRCVVAVFGVFLSFAYFANPIYAGLAGPMLEHMPQGSSMVAIEVASPFLAPFKFALVLSVFVAMPAILYQAWAFVAPGLYRHERRFVLPLLVASTLLFYGGIAFAYFIVFPLMFAFFASAAPTGIAIMTDINHYLDFVLGMFFAFGVAFEVPIATFVLVGVGIVTRESLVSKRPYIIVAAFVIGAVLTPPDVVSQMLLAVPLWVLFEVGLFVTRLVSVRPRASVQD